MRYQFQLDFYMGVSQIFPKIGVGPQNGWFIMVPIPIKMDDLGVPLFLETPIYHRSVRRLIVLKCRFVFPMNVFFARYLYSKICPMNVFLHGPLQHTFMTQIGIPISFGFKMFKPTERPTVKYPVVGA